MDIDEASLRVYSENFPNSHVIHADIRTCLTGHVGRKPSRRELSFVKSIGQVDVFLSGSPCQGFSPLNNRTRGIDERNSLYLLATRFVELALPTNFLFENVPDVLHGNVDVVDVSIETMTRLGYSVDSSVVDLSLMGVPQTRKRHLLIGSQARNVRISSMLKKSRPRKERSVGWAIMDLEQEAQGSIFRSPSVPSSQNLERINFLQRTGAFDLPNKMRPKCHWGQHSYKSMYGRLSYELPAQTITSGFGSPGQGRYVHPSRPRTLTPHEAARIQFFPDFFDFSSVQKKGELAKMIGNAAPMKLSQAFASYVLN